MEAKKSLPSPSTPPPHPLPFPPSLSPLSLPGQHRRPAEVLGHVHVAVRRRIDDAMWAVGHGGPLSLLPLTLPAVDLRSLQPLQGAPPGSSGSKRGAAISSSAYQQPGASEQVASRECVHAVPSLGVLSSSLAPAVLRVMTASLRRQMNVEELKGSSPCMLAYWLGHCLAFSEGGGRGGWEVGKERGGDGADGRVTSSAESAAAAAASAASGTPTSHPTSDAAPGGVSARNLDLVSAVISLSTTPQHADALKTHLLSHLLLDLPLWAPCGLVLMQELLGSVARVVPTEYHNMRAAGAVPVSE